MSAAEKAGHEATAEAILKAAAEVFAEKGYEGARVDELARAAGVNKATLYYQIGDKEALYHAVLDRVLGRAADEVERAIAQEDDCEARIRAVVEVFARHTGNMRYTAPIMMREVAGGGRDLPPSATGHMGRMLGALSETLDSGVECGRFRPVNNFMVHMMMVGSLMLYSANEPIRLRNVAANPDIHDPSHFISTEEAGQAIGDLILAAIRAPQPSAEDSTL